MRTHSLTQTRLTINESTVNFIFFCSILVPLSQIHMWLFQSLKNCINNSKHHYIYNIHVTHMYIYIHINSKNIYIPISIAFLDPLALHIQQFYIGNLIPSTWYTIYPIYSMDINFTFNTIYIDPWPRSIYRYIIIVFMILFCISFFINISVIYIYSI